MFGIWRQNTVMKLIRVLTALKHVSGVAYKKYRTFFFSVRVFQSSSRSSFLCLSFQFQLVSEHFRLLKSATKTDMNEHRVMYIFSMLYAKRHERNLEIQNTHPFHAQACEKPGSSMLI